MRIARKVDVGYRSRVTKRLCHASRVKPLSALDPASRVPCPWNGARNIAAAFNSRTRSAQALRSSPPKYRPRRAVFWWTFSSLCSNLFRVKDRLTPRASTAPLRFAVSQNVPVLRSFFAAPTSYRSCPLIGCFGSLMPRSQTSSMSLAELHVFAPHVAVVYVVVEKDGDVLLVRSISPTCALGGASECIEGCARLRAVADWRRSLRASVVIQHPLTHATPRTGSSLAFASLLGVASCSLLVFVRL